VEFLVLLLPSSDVSSSELSESSPLPPSLLSPSLSLSSSSSIVEKTEDGGLVSAAEEVFVDVFDAVEP
jgi:hypothetical protein